MKSTIEEFQRIAAMDTPADRRESMSSHSLEMSRVPLTDAEVSALSSTILPDLGGLLRPPDFEEPNFQRALAL